MHFSSQVDSPSGPNRMIILLVIIMLTTIINAFENPVHDFILFGLVFPSPSILNLRGQQIPKSSNFQIEFGGKKKKEITNPNLWR